MCDEWWVNELYSKVTLQAIKDVVNYELNHKYNIANGRGNNNFVSDQDYNSAKLFLEKNCTMEDDVISVAIKQYREVRERKINEDKRFKCRAKKDKKRDKEN